MNNKLRILIVSVVAILQLCAAIIMVVYSDNSGVSGNSPYDVVLIITVIISFPEQNEQLYASAFKQDK